jgi:hypothetical protein
MPRISLLALCCSRTSASWRRNDSIDSASSGKDFFETLRRCVCLVFPADFLVGVAIRNIEMRLCCLLRQPAAERQGKEWGSQKRQA